MKRAIIILALFALVILTAAVPPGSAETHGAGAADIERPQPASRDGHLEQGGKAIGRGYGQGGKEFGRGTAGFATNLVQGKFGQAGKSVGRGSAEFGKGVGKGTARGFKSFGRAFANLGRKIDRGVSGE